jgi:hypothetical protein
MSEMIPVAVRISDAALYQKIEDEVVILNMENQHYYGLDDVGASMWRALLQHGSLESAAASMEEYYDVDPSVLRRDLDALVRALIAEGLLQSA